MMDGKCETCKWWSMDVRDHYRAGRYRKCKHTEAVWDTPESMNMTLMVVDGKPIFTSSVSCDFVTGKTFGCIHHDPK